MPPERFDRLLSSVCRYQSHAEFVGLAVNRLCTLSQCTHTMHIIRCTSSARLHKTRYREQAAWVSQMMWFRDWAKGACRQHTLKKGRRINSYWTTVNRSNLCVLYQENNLQQNCYYSYKNIDRYNRDVDILKPSAVSTFYHLQFAQVTKTWTCFDIFNTHYDSSSPCA